MILLSFDIEEFDTPLEYGKQTPFEEQMQISIEGTTRILDLLAEKNILATFFCTANFADNAPDIVLRIVKEGHELASHGYYHSSFETSDLKKSKDRLEEISGTNIKGFRMARMMPFDKDALHEAGYKYDSSINPTFLPGRYNNLSEPKRWFRKNNIIHLPASVTPIFRFPLFWLSFHNLPFGLYKYLSSFTLKRMKYLNIYFHPWEFSESTLDDQYGMPSIIKRNTGDKMVERLGEFISFYQKKNVSFGRIDEFLKDLV